MVSGHQGCSNLCPRCQGDCLCPNCKKCHFCQCSERFILQKGQKAGEKLPHSCQAYKDEVVIYSTAQNSLYHHYSLAAGKNAWLESESKGYAKNWADEKEQTKRLRSEILRIGDDKLLVKNFAELFSSEPISIIVGPSKKSFTIHIDSLRRESTYFNEILSAKTSEDGPFLLDGGEHNIDAFEMFVEYCYFGTYFGYDEPHLLLLHARVYALAGKLKCLPLKAIALKKATEWSYGDSTRPEGSLLLSIVADLVEAIRVVYTYTEDSGHGFILHRPIPNDPSGSLEITRDRFRLLLAKLAGMHLNALKNLGEFVKVHHKFSDFNTDMLLFVRNAVEKPKASTSESRNALTDGQDESIQLRRNDISAFSRFFNTDTLGVFVGKQAKRFDVHISAVECAEFFKRLMTSAMIESRDKAVDLTSEIDTPDAFEKFVQYCYLQDYTCDKDRADTLTQHAAVYVLADRLICPGLKKLAHEKARIVCENAHAEKPDEVLFAIPAAVTLVYENTYDSHNTKLLEPLSNSQQDATNEASSSTEGTTATEGPPKGKNDAQTAASNVKSAPAPETTNRDSFRVLLSQFASLYISQLRTQEPFSSAHHRFPDFATDLMSLATPGKKFELGSDGQLKL
ncbi:hypothetical protein TWF970_004427 [Orbilia oligospora]|uniref:BTB domain-containing protein n=1 Tax=Orbilia oligospora TaxID=2813651 RepID=A0A7C8V8P5_ORBOL|nr:hypothetical protein TWF970_004427 [Orbilia oligospora]